MPLTLQVNGDIEERIEALVSGLCWAEELETSLEIYWWFFYPHIQCSFERCFSREKFPSWVVIRGGMLESAVSVQTERDFISKGYPSVIKSKHRFYEKDSQKWLSYLRLLRPSYEIRQRMNLIPSKGCVGLFIHNMPEPPIARVLAEIWKNQRDATGFLLSTDCYETKRFLKLMFQDRIFNINPLTKPNNELYILDRILTFFCLCQSSVILDSSQSLLMKLATEFGNTSLINL
jgi:hypothetical protein